MGGGSSNTASGLVSTVGGGFEKTASGESSAIGGGFNNIASGEHATVAGGRDNLASAARASVGGGFGNQASGTTGITVAGGELNTASGPGATIGGGSENVANGTLAVLPGGAMNSASGAYSFAAGRRAKAVNDGSFVWGDSTEADVASSANNQFIARAAGGVKFYSSTDTADPAPGVSLAAGASAWSVISDRDSKENFASVDGPALLARLDNIPIGTWNWRAQGPTVRHMGPMAQDFYAAFAVGEDDQHISTVDADGVALAAIQALYRMLLEKDEQLNQEAATLAALQAELAKVREELARQARSSTSQD